MLPASRIAPRFFAASTIARASLISRLINYLCLIVWPIIAPPCYGRENELKL
jgi:hypothetical protein